MKPGEPIPVLASFDKHPLAPGDYQLLATITQGAASREQRVSFSISPEIGEDLEPERALKQEEHPDTATYRNFAAIPKLIENASRPTPSEMQTMLSGARQRVVDYKRTLPNLVCMRVTRRFVDPAGRGTWKSKDSYAELLRYVAGQETATLLDFDGKSVRGLDIDIEGATLHGEFGELLNMVFSEKASATIEWQGIAQVAGTRTHVFRYRVSRPHSEYQVIAGHSGAGSVILAAYDALVYIDANTLGIRRVSIEALELPKNFHVRESALTVDYDYVPIGGQDYLLPLEATLFVRQGAHYLSRNQIQFENYRKYGAQSSLKEAKKVP